MGAKSSTDHGSGSEPATGCGRPLPEGGLDLESFCDTSESPARVGHIHERDKHTIDIEHEQETLFPAN